jgi:hypothetical protein
MSSTLLAAAPVEFDDWSYDDDQEVEDSPRSRSPLAALAPVEGPAHPPVQFEHELSAAELRSQFELLADELAAVAIGVSALQRLRRHPAYVEILSLGERTIPLLLQRLDQPGARPLWLSLLGSLTGFQPGAGKETIPEAASAWVSWGKRRGPLAT